MTVWVIHPVKEDLSAAAHYGELRYVHRGGYVHGDELTETPIGERIPMALRADIAMAVKLFKPDKDYLMLVGDHLQLSDMCARLGVQMSCFRVLRYDRIAQGYYPVTIGG